MPLDDDASSGDSVGRLVSAYLQLRQQNAELYMLNAPSEGALKGAFNLFGLDARFSFVNQEYLSKAEKVIESFSASLDSSTDLSRRLDDAELVDLLDANPEILESLRVQELLAHENFHALQICALRSGFTLAQSYRTIERWKSYFGAVALGSTGATFKEGDCIFDTLRFIPDYQRLLGSTLRNLLENVKLAIDAAKIQAEGLSLLHLIEGSAFIAQKMSVRTFTVPTFNVSDKPLYDQAWQVYQRKGGHDELVFILVCLAALRFGDIEPEYAHPVDIFLSLANNAPAFEKSAAEAFSPSPFGAPSPFINRSIFGGDSDADLDEEYFYHLDGGDVRQKASLAQYRREANDQVNSAVDFALKISRKIAQHVKSNFDEIGSRVDEAQMAASYVDGFLRAYGKDIYERFPAANTEEFCLRFLFDRDLRQAFGDCATDAAGKTIVQEISGNAFTGNEARALSDILHSLETLALYDPDKPSLLPYCCELHPVPGDFDVFIECRHEESLNALIRNMCGREIRDLIILGK